MSISSNPAIVEDCQLRPFHCELNVLSRPDGSAIVSQGETVAVAGVYGPVEVKPNKILIEKASVEVIYRPKSGLPYVTDRLYESTLQDTLEAAILTTQYPRTLISISVQEMHNSGGLLACAINAGCLAIMNSGLSMRFLVAAVHCMLDEDDEIVLDPDEKQVKDYKATFMFAFDNIDKSIVSSSSYGKFTEAQYQKALLICRSACGEIFQLYREIVQKYAPSIRCEESHLCFGKEAEPAHKESHLCFGRRFRPQLDDLEARAVASVLADAVAQLAVMAKTLPEAPADEQEQAGLGGLAQGAERVARSPRPPPSPRVFPEAAGRRPPLTEALLKVQREGMFAATVLDEVLAELCDRGSFASLRKSLDRQTAVMADELRLVEQHQAGLKRRRDLAEQLVRDRRNMLDQRVFWEKKTELLTSNLQDTYLLGGLAISYADTWEHNRREQQAFILSQREDALHDTIEHIQDPDGPNEEHVHSEIMRFLAQDIEMLKKDLDHWTDLYDAEMMQRETAIMQLHNALEQQKEEHAELRTEEQQREKIKEQAVVLRNEHEGQMKVLSNIVAIQAWWRGVSYRAGIPIGKSRKKKKKRKGVQRKKGLKIKDKSKK